MPWSGIWFEHEAGQEWGRSPEWFEGGLVEPRIYPYAHNFIDAEHRRLEVCQDPRSARRDGERVSVYYSLSHDGGQTGLDQQGCSILYWLFENFCPEASNPVSARFSEVPVVIHETDPVKAAALGNALTLLRFLGAREDQAVARILIHPWDPRRGSPRLAAQDYERRVIEFLRGDLFYPEEITMFDVLGRNDLRAHRVLPPCCQTQIGFAGPLLEWIDECWPGSEDEARELERSLKNSLADEVRYWLERHPPVKRERESRFI